MRGYIAGFVGVPCAIGAAACRLYYDSYEPSYNVSEQPSVFLLIGAWSLALVALLVFSWWCFDDDRVARSRRAVMAGVVDQDVLQAINTGSVRPLWRTALGVVFAAAAFFLALPVIWFCVWIAVVLVWKNRF